MRKHLESERASLKHRLELQSHELQTLRARHVDADAACQVSDCCA